MEEPTLLPSGTCPCGSKKTFAACCGPFLREGIAPTAEALMRSRYTANVLGDASYLTGTWHARTRPAQLDLRRRLTWISLEVLAASEQETAGTVEFVAHYREDRRTGILHETSRFVREDGRWYYVDGDLHQSASAERTGRNDPCPCGSGRKFKKCCG